MITGKILEAKSVGKLFHVCSIKSLIYNLTNNIITPGQKPNQRLQTKSLERSISFTRNSSYVVDTISSDDGLAFQIVLNGNKLSENYPIEPYADIKHGYSRIESEEAVFGKEITNLKDYIIAINVIILNYETLSENVKEKTFCLQLIKALTLITSLNNPCFFKKSREALLYGNITTIPTDIQGFLTWCKTSLKYNVTKLTNTIDNLQQKYRITKSSTITKIQCETVLADSKFDILKLTNSLREGFITETNVVITSETTSTAVEKRYTQRKFLNFLDRRDFTLNHITVNSSFDNIANVSPSIVITLSDSERYEYKIKINIIPVF